MFLLAVTMARAGCEPSTKPPASNARYLVTGESFYDEGTDLTWMRCTVGQRWAEGHGCVGDPKKFTHAEANRPWAKGWRIPTRDELKTLVQKNCREPSIDDVVFPNTPASWYHTNGKSGSLCWQVSFRDGAVDRYYCDNEAYVRLVRPGK